jgi:tetratricopeptide (TPR) repeat protein
MAKQRRPAPSAVRAKKKTAKAPGKGGRKTPARAASGRTRTIRAAGSSATTLQAAAAPAPPAPPPPAPKKPGFYEAVAIYERGVQALQRHDYAAAAESFRAVLERYPEERELLERAVLYLRVCERETARQPPAPRTPAERVYAATLALNSGDHAAAHDHLQRALSEDPESDHAHYTMAVLLGMRAQVDEALVYLKNAIGLNQENRSLARQDPDLEPVRGHQNFAAVLDTPAMRRRAKPRR